VAKRPVFIPKKDSIGVRTELVEFVWSSGYAISQKQKSIDSLHSNLASFGCKNPLEISSKSKNELGVRLSAFNLSTTSQIKKKPFTVEMAFQSSKVFEGGGPYLDLLEKDSRSAKKDPRIHSSGRLVEFKFFGRRFPISPPTFFYDWLYINTLIKNNDLLGQVVRFDAFTDIEFNPEKSINCQAYSVALLASMLLKGITYNMIRDPEKFLEFNMREYSNRWKNRMLYLPLEGAWDD